MFRSTFKNFSYTIFSCKKSAIATLGGIVDFFRRMEKNGFPDINAPAWSPENIVEIEKRNLLLVVEKINKQARYPLLALRLFLHVICGIDADGKINISARQMAKTLDAHYDTVTKCLKYLREIEVIRLDR